MRIAIGSDHAGYQLKRHLVDFLRRGGHDVDDRGTHSENAVDYPIICADVALAVVDGAAARGIVIGGSGQGEQIAANKVRGARAALCNDLYTARMSRSHNDANVLAIGGRIVAPGLAEEIVTTWLDTPFDGGRHQRRVDQIAAIELQMRDAGHGMRDAAHGMRDAGHGMRDAADQGSGIRDPRSGIRDQGSGIRDSRKR